MDNTMTWRTERPLNPGDDSACFESTLHDHRLKVLKDLVLMLLSEVESLQFERPTHAEGAICLQNQVQRFESDLIRQALYRAGGNQAQAARLLGVKHTTLNAKIHRYGISLIGRLDESESLVHEDEIAA
jgi:transcriptional regulator with GAF, ATPase, and Fis domain